MYNQYLAIWCIGIPITSFFHRFYANKEFLWLKLVIEF